MNGAEALLESLSKNGVDVCFANPGTSEMHLVAAIDKHPTMRAVLGLFEGVVTGAADGYGRMADKPAATLLHLGPGLANGCANLHNARRARTPVVNIVGDHAVEHLKYDAPLTSDIEGIARTVSDWVATSPSPHDLAAFGGKAVAASLCYPGQVSTLIVPADHAWSEGGDHISLEVPPSPTLVSEQAVADCLKLISSDAKGAIFLGGKALREEALVHAGQIAQATGLRLICETFPARLQRGEGRVPVERLPYFGEAAMASLHDLEFIILAGAPAPVAFFAYPDKQGWFLPEEAEVQMLASPREDVEDALGRLASALGVGTDSAPAPVQQRTKVEVPEGPLTSIAVGAVLAEHLPEDAIVSDEATTAGPPIYGMLAGAPRHDWLTLTGGAIGQGLPVAVGAAVACPNRQVIALQADGSGMYTLQALWTMARENLNVTVILINNGSYAILKHELQRVGVSGAGAKAMSLLDLTSPALDWAKLAQGMGVSAECVSSSEEFEGALAAALAHPGPYLIEAVVRG